MSITLPPVPGTITVTNGSATVTGVGTAFSVYRKGYTIVLPSGASVVLASDPTDDATATIIQTFTGTTETGVPFCVLQRADGATIASEARTLIEMLRATDVLGVSASWKFTVATTAAHPGDGYLRFNNAAFSSVTEIYISDLDSRNVDFGSWLDSLVGAQVLFRSATRPNKSIVFRITAVDDSTLYRTLTVTHINGVPDFQVDEDLVVVGSATGLQGVQGIQGIQGPENSPVFDLVVDDPGQPGSGEELAKHIFTRVVTYLALMAGSKVAVGVYPTAVAQYSFTKNAVEFATLSIATNGTPTFAGSQTVFAIGDVLRVIAPNPRDDTLAAVSMTLAGTRS